MDFKDDRRFVGWQKICSANVTCFSKDTGYAGHASMTPRHKTVSNVVYYMTLR